MSPATSDAPPVIVTVKIIEDRQWICPHCKQPISEKGTFYDLRTGQYQHRECGGVFTPPPATPEDSQLLKFFGLKEGIDTLEVISESVPKSLREKINRHVRVGEHSGAPKPEPVVRKEGDNNPKRTVQGRRNYRGHRKARQDANARKHPEKFREHVEFIRNNIGKPADVILEQARNISDPTVTLEILDKLGAQQFSKQSDATQLRDLLKVYLEAKQYECGPYLARLGDATGEEKARHLAEEKASRIRKYYPDVRVDKRVSGVTNVVGFYVIGQGHTDQK